MNRLSLVPRQPTTGFPTLDMLADPFGYLGQLQTIQSRNTPAPATSGGSKEQKPPKPPVAQQPPPSAPAQPPAQPPTAPAAPAGTSRTAQYDAQIATAEKMRDAQLAALTMRSAQGGTVDPLEYKRIEERFNNQTRGAYAGKRLGEKYERQRQRTLEIGAENRKKREAARAARTAAPTAPTAPTPATAASSGGPDTTQTVETVKPYSPGIGQTSVDSQNQRYLQGLVAQRYGAELLQDPRTRAINDQVGRVREIAKATPAGQISDLAAPSQPPAPPQYPYLEPRPWAVGLELPAPQPDVQALRQQMPQVPDYARPSFNLPQMDPAVAAATAQVSDQYRRLGVTDFSDPLVARKYEQDVERALRQMQPGGSAGAPVAIPQGEPQGVLDTFLNTTVAPGGLLGAPLPPELAQRAINTAPSETARASAQGQAATAAMQEPFLTLVGGGLVPAMRAGVPSIQRPAQGVSGQVTSTAPARPRVNLGSGNPAISVDPNAGPSFTTNQNVKPYRYGSEDMPLPPTTPTPRSSYPVSPQSGLGGAALESSGKIVERYTPSGQVTVPRSTLSPRGRDVDFAAPPAGPANAQGGLQQIQQQNARLDARAATQAYVDRMLAQLDPLGVLPNTRVDPRIAEEAAFLNATLRRPAVNPR